MKTPLLALLILSAALAGCGHATTDDETHVTFDFAGKRAAGEQQLEFDIPYDPEARPTATFYSLHGDTHPGFYTAFDQLEQALKSVRMTYEATHDAQFGFFLSTVDGVPGDGSAYWSMAVNGVASAVGMGDVQLQAGDEILWTLTQIQALPGNPSASPTPGSAQPGRSDLVAVDDVPATTMEDLLTITGTLAPGATLVARLDGKPLTPILDDGAFRLDVPLQYGHAELRLLADDGKDSDEVRIALVRLAQATLEVEFTAQLPPKAPLTALVTYDPEGFVSAPMYEGRSKAHPGFATVHDLMVAWSAQEGRVVEYSYFDSLGFSVDTIDGVGHPVTSAAPPYWCYSVNGATAELGISLQPVAPGDVVRWDYGGAC